MLTKQDILSAIEIIDSHNQRSDYDLNPDAYKILKPNRTLRPAAVLCPLVERAHGIQVILTQRPNHMKAHAGQISFPGGKIERYDESALAAALRESEEEIGLTADMVEPLGKLAAYETGTQFLITPFVGWVSTEFVAIPDPSEVEEVFEVPLDFLTDPENLKKDFYMRDGFQRNFYVMPYENRNIWGATAGMLKNLADGLNQNFGKGI